VSITTLNEQLVTLRDRCRADSLRLENELATQRATPPIVQPPAPVNDSLLKARTAEVAALKDQLLKVSAELDRIKRRLANPRG
jgi:molecular chaperone GrpE (heat shock protein)